MALVNPAKYESCVRLAQNLHPRLLRFFAKYPPPALTQSATGITAPSETATTATTSTVTPTDANSSATELASKPSESEPLPYRNPFAPHKNFVTGKWHGPVYGLRRQAELCKLARSYGVEELLPYTVKKSGEKEKRRLERGLRVKGTGVGEKVKGHAWERTLHGRLEKRKDAMLNMPEMIQTWKQVRSSILLCLSGCTSNVRAERSWPWMEKVAQIKDCIDFDRGGIGTVRSYLLRCTMELRQLFERRETCV